MAHEYNSGNAKMAELVSVFEELTERMGEISTTNSSKLLFRTLKFSFPLLRSLPEPDHGSTHCSRALYIAFLLADLKMDAQVISAGLLREVIAMKIVTMEEVEKQIGTGVTQILQDSLHIKNITTHVETLDDETAKSLRNQCLTDYDIKALILELAIRLDTMKHLEYYPKYDQQSISLEVLKIYAPLAHAVGAGSLSLELEDYSFRYIFPTSYLYIDGWLKSHEGDSKPLLDIYKDKILQALNLDKELSENTNGFKIKGRYKTRFSAMKKLLRDGRKPEEVHDILGMRIVLDPKAEYGDRSCYRTYEVIKTVCKDVPSRFKDYIEKPKGGGYRSLHIAIDLTDHGESVIPMMEVQIRTVEMDVFGSAAHSIYKGGIHDPEEAKRLKDIMLAAADMTALHLKDLPSANKQEELKIDPNTRLFRFLDENGDGQISMEELTTVMEELGAAGKDAEELMQRLDTNGDGFLSAEEFSLLKTQVGFMRSIDAADDQYKTILEKKLHITHDCNGMIQVYRKQLSDKLAESQVISGVI